MSKFATVREVTEVIGTGPLAHSVTRWEVTGPTGTTLVTARQGEQDWQRVERHVRASLDYRSRADLLAEALEQIVERGDVNEEGSAAALAYSALIESGYD